jgi:hypothetical protein
VRNPPVQDLRLAASRKSAMEGVVLNPRIVNRQGAKNTKVEDVIGKK